jgi:N-methylhydantoinase B/oxoprolinase/acetone carboxylase alpha subunit
VDFAGSSPQSRWGINVPLGYITAYTTYALKNEIVEFVDHREATFLALGYRPPNYRIHPTAFRRR